MKEKENLGALQGEGRAEEKGRENDKRETSLKISKQTGRQTEGKRERL